MIRITAEKSSFTPMVFTSGGVKVCFGYTDLSDMPGIGTWLTHTFLKVPTSFELRNFILDTINSGVKSSILEYTFEDGDRQLTAYLSTENQANYKAAYDLAVQTGGANLPYTLKCGTIYEPEYYTIHTVEAFTDFYVGMNQHITACVEAGWKLKDAIDWSQYDTDKAVRNKQSV